MSFSSWRFLLLVLVFSGACARWGQPPVYAPPSVRSPHAELIVRTANHSTVPGVLLDRTTTLNGVSLGGHDVAPRLGLRQEATRVAPGTLTMNVGSVFFEKHLVRLLVPVTVYVKVNGKTDWFIKYEFHPALEDRVLAACRLKRSIDVRAGKRYMVQYDYYGDGDCRATCRTTDARGRLIDCPAPSAARVASR